MSKTVTVTVSGQAGTGKSTIASIIATALGEHDIRFNVDLLDGKLPNDMMTEVHVASLREHGIEVTIVEQQAHRTQ